LFVRFLVSSSLESLFGMAAVDERKWRILGNYRRA